MSVFRLEDAAGVLAPLALSDANGIEVEQFDLGHPDVRAAVQLRVQADGTIDRTAFVGDRAVTLNVMIFPSPTRTKQATVDALAPFLYPGRRVYLYFATEASGVERRLLCRADSFAAPLENVFYQRAQIGLRGIDGFTESAAQTLKTMTVGSETELGRAYDLTFDRTYPASAVIGSVIVNNAGTTYAYPLVRIYGPCTDPKLENKSDANRYIKFTGLTLAAGEYVELDFRERTAYAGGDPTANRYHLIDFVNSDWWRLVPGDNLVRFIPATSSAGAKADLFYRHAYL